MTFRARLRLAFVSIVLVPVVGFALVVRHEMARRLTAQYEHRVAALVTVIEQDLQAQSEAIAQALSALSEALRDDNRFRRAAVDEAASERPYLLDYARDAMRLTGLGMLQIQDEKGRIISSGHFRMEYDRLEPELPKLLASVPEGLALVEARTPESSFLALARVDSFRMGGRPFTLVGGVSAERRFLADLAREQVLAIALVYPGGVVTSLKEGDSRQVPGEAVAGSQVAGGDEAVVGELAVPFADASRRTVEPALIRVTHSLSELRALRRSIDLWLSLAVAATALVAVLLANWLSARMGRPLAELARKTSRIDLDRLDIDFSSRRKDEIGALSRLLGSMTERLQLSAGRVKEAERRATLGELARQVNHDIKNGLMPIRNVFRHLAQVARDAPHHLPDVLRERQPTIDAGIAYLENLASNYARLYPRLDRQPCEVNTVVRQVVAAARRPGGAELRMALDEENPTVMGDAVVLRRIVENLVDNAIDSLEEGSGTVTVSTCTTEREGKPTVVRIEVADSGKGMSEEERGRAFDDFYTTKEDGTGLGLSIVRRLVTDLNGSVRVESEVGKGSRFTVELPAAAAAPGPKAVSSNPGWAEGPGAEGQRGSGRDRGSELEGIEGRRGSRGGLR